MPAFSGKIFLYRVFDTGPDIDLEKLQKCLLSETNAQRFRLTKSTRAMIINNAPLSLTLEGGRHEALGYNLEFEVAVKVWHFGAISVNLQIAIPPDITWDRLIELGVHIENDQTLHQVAVKKVTQILQQFGPNGGHVVSWNTYEDYILYFFKTLPGAETHALTVFQLYDVYRLIMMENTETLSEQVKKTISDGAIQYSQNDLAVINWNSALIIEPSGFVDIPDTIEFALCQLLEMRYYDDLLDSKLAFLYAALEKKRISIWGNYTQRLSKEAAQRYLEISDTVESVENSLKVVGDFYLAQVFRMASSRFRFNDWRDSVNQKLNNLAAISKLLTTEINERRNQLLEVVIIVLISIEVVPLIIQVLRTRFHLY